MATFRVEKNKNYTVMSNHHLVFDSVFFMDGKKYRNNKGLYWQFQRLSDELCQLQNLSVIHNPRYQNRPRETPEL